MKPDSFPKPDRPTIIYWMSAALVLTSGLAILFALQLTNARANIQKLRQDAAIAREVEKVQRANEARERQRLLDRIAINESAMLEANLLAKEIQAHVNELMAAHQSGPQPVRKNP